MGKYKSAWKRWKEVRAMRKRWEKPLIVSRCCWGNSLTRYPEEKWEEVLNALMEAGQESRKKK